jgi:hypothetical protein
MLADGIAIGFSRHCGVPSGHVRWLHQQRSMPYIVGGPEHKAKHDSNNGGENFRIFMSCASVFKKFT